MKEFFEDIKKSDMGEYEYNTAMGDVCILNAINAYTKGDGALMTFYKNAEIAFRTRALEAGCQNTKAERIMKSLPSWKSGIAITGIKTPSGVCIY